jgi:hypothetical protein
MFAALTRQFIRAGTGFGVLLMAIAAAKACPWISAAQPRPGDAASRSACDSQSSEPAKPENPKPKEPPPAPTLLATIPDGVLPRPTSDVCSATLCKRDGLGIARLTPLRAGGADFTCASTNFDFRVANAAEIVPVLTRRWVFVSNEELPGTSSTGPPLN